MGNIVESAWFEKHRPDSIDDIVFTKNDHYELAKKWLENNRIDGNILLSGPAGTGKTTLSQVLIRTLIKTQADIYRMKTRSVKEIDELQSWITKKPVKSTHNIVYIEEMDKLSKEAQVTLKDGMLEKYIDTCIFICCTNHPKKIDKALISRFTYHFYFDSNNLEGIKNRVVNILKTENAKYNPDELEMFLKNNYKKGLRNIINGLQKSYIVNNGSVIFKEVDDIVLLEDTVCQLVINIFKLISKSPDPKQRQACLLLPLNSIIAKEWSELCIITHNNFDIQYDEIFENLIDSTNFLPIQNILIQYFELLDHKKYSDLHFRSCIYECIKSLIELHL